MPLPKRRYLFVADEVTSLRLRIPCLDRRPRAIGYVQQLAVPGFDREKDFRGVGLLLFRPSADAVEYRQNLFFGHNGSLAQCPALSECSHSAAKARGG